jgi:hypothetical protein
MMVLITRDITGNNIVTDCFCTPADWTGNLSYKPKPPQHRRPKEIFHQLNICFTKTITSTNWWIVFCLTWDSSNQSKPTAFSATPPVTNRPEVAPVHNTNNINTPGLLPPQPPPSMCRWDWAVQVKFVGRCREFPPDINNHSAYHLFTRNPETESPTCKENNYSPLLRSGYSSVSLSPKSTTKQISKQTITETWAFGWGRFLKIWIRRLILT